MARLRGFVILVLDFGCRRCSITSTVLAGHGEAGELVRGSGLAWLVLVAKGQGEARRRRLGTG
jgi:hypothetical protein